MSNNLKIIFWMSATQHHDGKTMAKSLLCRLRHPIGTIEVV